MTFSAPVKLVAFMYSRKGSHGINEMNLPQQREQRSLLIQRHCSRVKNHIAVNSKKMFHLADSGSRADRTKYSQNDTQ